MTLTQQQNELPALHLKCEELLTGGVTLRNVELSSTQRNLQECANGIDYLIQRLKEIASKEDASK